MVFEAERERKRVNNLIETQYVPNVPRFVLGQYPTSIENNPFVPLELTPGFNLDADDIWPRRPEIYPDFLKPPPDWRTCDRPEITRYLPGLKGTLKN